MYFTYGEKELDFLRQKDKRLAKVIDRIGPVHRTVDTDLFSAVVHHIIGQQISTKAQATIWQRMCDALEDRACEDGAGRRCGGITGAGHIRQKAEYITDFAQKVLDGNFDIEAVWSMPDDEAIKALSSLNGIGVWTAEMILLFCMQRPNILSYGDLAIQRGMRMVYHHRKIDRKLFEKYRRRLSPYCSVASLYFLGGGRRCVAGHEGLRAKDKETNRKAKEISPQLTMQNTIKNEKSRSITLRPFPL